MADTLDSLLEYKMGVLPTGDITLEIGYASTLDEALAGQIRWTRLAMTVKQARELADDLRQTAASSRQTPDAGNA